MKLKFASKLTPKISVALLAVLAAVMATVATPAAAQSDGPVDVLFSPSVAITISQLDADGDGRNDFFGTSFGVEFTNSADGCTAAASQDHFVISTGSVNLSSAAARLLAHPDADGDGNADPGAPECAYAISWTIAETPHDHSNLSLQPGATSTVSTSSRSATAAYVASPATYFRPDVSVSVTDAASGAGSSGSDSGSNSGGASDLSSTSFTVTFRSISGSFVGCTTSASVAMVLRGRASGSGSATAPVTAEVSGPVPSLVGFPEGVKYGCVYEVSWPGIEGLELQVDTTRRITPFERSAQANYLVTTAEVGDFSPAVSIAVPQVDVNGDGTHDFSGTRFEVVFRKVLNSADSCTLSASQLHVLGDNGRVTLSGSAASLLDRAQGSSTECIYSVSWPTVANLVRQSGATSMVRISARAATATYAAEAASRFKPAVAISVPPTDADGDGRNDFSGTRFLVEFRRRAGAGAGSGSSASANASCTATASATYVVADSGSVEVAGAVPDLVDRGVGGTAGCIYDVIWPVVGATGSTTLELRPGASQQVSAASRRITARYEGRTGSSFRPSVSIGLVEGAGVSGGGASGDNLAAGYSGTRFVVSLVPATGFESSCTALARVTLVVRDSGQVAVSGVVPSLSDRPAGLSGNCRYDVRWPELSGLELQTGATATVSASAPSASATYEIVAAAPSGGGSGGGTSSGAGLGTGAGSGSGTGTGGADTLFQTNVINLPRGWSVLPFGGPSGMSPADFAQAMEGAINSVWVWGRAAQQWQGWTQRQGSVGLSALEPGDVAMVYVPVGRVVVYDPPGLLGFEPGASGWTLSPEGISLVVYGGNRATASQVFARFAGSAVVVYMWDAPRQRWEYHLPGRQRLSGVDIPWFTTVEPGDAMFVYNVSPVEVTIPWR